MTSRVGVRITAPNTCSQQSANTQVNSSSQEGVVRQRLSEKVRTCEVTERRNSGEMADSEGSGLSAGNLETIVDMVVAKLQGAAREGHASASTKTMEGTATASEGESTRD